MVNNAIAQGTRAQTPTVWKWLGFLRKPPCANSFRNLLMALPPETLEGVLRGWVGSLLDEPLPDQLRGTSLDGKTLCNTLAAFRNAAISLLRVTGHPEIAVTLRGFSYQPLKLLKFLGIMKH